MKTCQEIYFEKAKENIRQAFDQRQKFPLMPIYMKENIELKIDAIMEFLSQPEFMNPVYFYRSMEDYCKCFELKPGMAVHTKDDMKTCAKCNKPLRMI